MESFSPVVESFYQWGAGKVPGSTLLTRDTRPEQYPQGRLTRKPRK